MYDVVASVSRQAAADACWLQWSALKGEGVVVGEARARAIIDPEALVLASLALRQHERRLQDLLAWWAGKGARLLSVQRLQTMRGSFPDELLEGGLEWFARRALHGGDFRWKRLATGGGLDEQAREGKGPRELRLVEPSSLMLRLRAGFGVGAKADLVAFLIGSSAALVEGDVWTTANVIAEATFYSHPSVKRALSEMVLARLVRRSDDRPSLYSLDVPAWARVLGLRDPFRARTVIAEPFAAGDLTDVPPWRFWAQRYAFLLASAVWADDALAQDAAAVVQASRARDVVERFPRALTWSGITGPDPHVDAGERYVAAFVALVQQVAAATAEGV